MGAIQVCTLYDVVFGISPVQLLGRVVQSEAVGPEERRVGDDCTVQTIHATPLNLGCAAPVSPKQGPATNNNRL